MPKANSRIPASNQVFPNLNPNHALVETPKPKLLHRLREGLRSHPYSLRLRHASLFKGVTRGERAYHRQNPIELLKSNLPGEKEAFDRTESLD